MLNIHLIKKETIRAQKENKVKPNIQREVKTTETVTVTIPDMDEFINTQVLKYAGFSNESPTITIEKVASPDTHKGAVYIITKRT